VYIFQTPLAHCADLFTYYLFVFQPGFYMVVLTQTGIFCLRPDCVIRLPSEANNPVKRREFHMSIKLLAGFVLMSAVGLFPTGCGGSGPQVNLALNKPVTASSFEKGTHHNGGKDLVPEAACDGDTLTRWGSDFNNDADPDAAWIYVDLGAKKEVHSVNIYWEEAFAKRFGIEVSDDAKTWTEVAAGNMTPPEFRENGGLSEVVFNNPVQARFVKMNGLQRGGRYGYSLYELEVY
jgi:hypothetical protein